jgi:hypothetical protein
MPIHDDHRAYYGAGVPRGESRALFDRPNASTAIHEVELHTGVNRENRPFPIAQCLLDSNGKMKAAVALTISYARVIDAAPSAMNVSAPVFSCRSAATR